MVDGSTEWTELAARDGLDRGWCMEQVAWCLKELDRGPQRKSGSRVGVRQRADWLEAIRMRWEAVQAVLRLAHGVEPVALPGDGGRTSQVVVGDVQPRGRGRVQSADLEDGEGEDVKCLDYGSFLEDRYGRESVEFQNWERLGRMFAGELTDLICPEGIEGDGWLEGASEEMRGLLRFVPLEHDGGGVGDQGRFLASQAVFALVIGGNASGKTVSAVARIAWELLTGSRKGRLPVHGWAVRESFPPNMFTDPIYSRIWYGDERFEPFVPKVMQAGDSVRGRVLRLTNGSTLEFRSYGQGSKRQAGFEPDFILCDEPPPEAVFNELRGRLLRKDRPQMLMSFTDVAGYSWMDDLLEDAQRRPEVTQVFTLRTDANRYLNSEVVGAVEGTMDSRETALRIRGESAFGRGLVYRCFGDRNWIAPDDLPIGTDYCFIDPGIANPCACLWVRCPKPELREITPGVWKEQQDLVLHQEYYKPDTSDVAVHADGIFSINRKFRLQPVAYFIDIHEAQKRTVDIGRVRTVQDVWTEAMRCPLRLGPGGRAMRRYERFRKTEKYVRLEMRSFPNLYASDALRWFKKELGGYHIEGMVKTTSQRKVRSERFTGHDHLIYGMESAVLLAMTGQIRYIADMTGMEVVRDPLVVASERTWESMRSGLGPIGLTPYLNMVSDEQAAAS